MTSPADSSHEAARLHQRAETEWRKRQGGAAPRNREPDPRRLVQELEVHQIELEMQNAELAQAREAAEAALRHATDLFDFAPVAYLMVDRDGVILEANLAGATLLGATRAALRGRSLLPFVVPTSRPVFAAFLDGAFKDGQRIRREVGLAPEDGPALELECDAIVAADGLACRVALLDRSERNRAAAERLVLSKLESTGILAGGIAHDLNNLLVTIILNLDMARLTLPDNAKLSHYLEDAKKSAFLARNLTQQLISFSRGGAPVCEAFHLPAVITESVRLALSGAPVQHHLALAEDLWPVHADAGQIGQVLHNLVLNAREAMPEGGVVRVEAENVQERTADLRALPPGPLVRVSVVDEGDGIAAENLPKIFDPYFSTKTRGQKKGMGLGLSICHSIIQKHGGLIAVKTAPAQGTTFTFFLPAAREAQPNVPADRSPAAHTRRAHILLMDDTDALRAVCGVLLRQLGHHVELVESGEAAVSACAAALRREEPFDIALLDMTIRDGWGGVATIHALHRIAPGLKGILMSGHAEDPVVRDFSRHGFAAVLVKPFDSLQVQEVLTQVLGPFSAGIPAT